MGIGVPVEGARVAGDGQPAIVGASVVGPVGEVVEPHADVPTAVRGVRAQPPRQRSEQAFGVGAERESSRGGTGAATRQYSNGGCSDRWAVQELWVRRLQ